MGLAALLCGLFLVGSSRKTEAFRAVCVCQVLARPVPSFQGDLAPEQGPARKEPLASGPWPGGGPP